MKKNYLSAISISLSLFILLFSVPGTVMATVAKFQPVVVKDTMPPAVIIDKVYRPEEVDAKVEFPGGFSEWGQYVAKNVNAIIPIDKGAPYGTYTVKILCTVTKKGRLKDFKPQTKHGYGMENEFIRALRKSPDWIAARINGQHVDSYTIIPFTFVIMNGAVPAGKRND
jgi:hypothetical protein